MSIKRIIVAIMGGTILLVGIAMIVLPGPAVVVIPIGLGVLATEFIWAQRWLRRARGMATSKLYPDFLCSFTRRRSCRADRGSTASRSNRDPLV
jgi:hypothetical protein